MKFIKIFIFLIFNISNISAFSYEKLVDRKELVQHFSIEEIENIKIPKNWSLVKDIKYYDEVIQDHYKDMGSPKIVRELQANNGDQLCFDHLKNLIRSSIKLVKNILRWELNLIGIVALCMQNLNNFLVIL